MNALPNNPRTWLALVIALVSASAGPVALAQGEPSVEDVKQAGEEFNLGRTAFQAEEYVAAAEHFERADSLAPNPKVLLLAIQARDLAGQGDRAATLAALAQERYPDDAIFGDTRKLITKALTDLSKLKVTCSPACTLLVDGRLVHGEAATKRFLFLPPGEHSVRAGWEGGEEDTQAFTAERGGSGKLSFERPGGGSTVGAVGEEDEEEIDWGDEPDEPAAASGEDGLPKPVITYDELDEKPADTGPTPEGAGLSPTVFWIGAGVTGALAGVSTWSGIDTQNNPGRDAVQQACSSGADNCQSLYEQGKDAEQRTNILWGATAGMGVVTILIGSIWTDWGGPGVPADVDDTSAKARERQGVALQPFLDLRGGTMVGARGRF